MYEALVVLVILGVIAYFAWQRMMEMSRLTRAASNSPYICYGAPVGEDTHCIHWYDGEPCCWCKSYTPEPDEV